MQARHKLSGFTLLELLVTISVGALILTLGVPSFRGTIDNQRMISANNELVMSLNLAKSEAIKRVTYVSVCKSSTGIGCTGGGTTWNDGWIVFANSTVANLGSVDAGDEIIRIFPSLRDGLTVTPIGNIDGFISFRPSGTIGTGAANMAGTLTTCDKRGAAYARGIVLQSSGQWNVTHDQAHDESDLACP